MSIYFQAFKRRVNLFKQELARIVLHQYGAQPAIAQEGLAIRTLIRIVDSALKLAREQGFALVQWRELGAATGLSLSELHHYARSKDELARLIQSYGHSLTARLLLDEIAGLDHPLDRLRAAVRTQLWLSEIWPEWFLFEHLEMRALNAAEQRQAIEAELSVEELFSNIIRSGQRQGLFRAVDPELTATALQALLQEWYLMSWRHVQRRLTVENYEAFVQDMIERYLLPDGVQALPARSAATADDD